MSGLVERCVHGHKCGGSVVRCTEWTYTSAQKLQVSVSRGHPVVFMYNIKMK